MGKLIVFEGVEGCGKTTQLRHTQEWLSGRFSVLVTREPGGTPLGSELRRLLLGNYPEHIDDRTELLLYAADRSHHVNTCLLPALANGVLVLCDRFTDSTIAYQHYGRGLDRALVDQLNQIATGGLVPDLVLWLDVDVDTGLERTRSRGGCDRIEQAEIAFHQRVQQGFQALHEADPQRIVRIDASLSENDMFVQVYSVLSRYFGVL